jgi:hypothetical protein
MKCVGSKWEKTGKERERLGGGGYISCVYKQPVRLLLFDSADHPSTKPEQNLKSSKNATHPSVYPLPTASHFSIHPRLREANWASEQKATILVSIYSYRPCTHVVTNNGCIDLQTETMPGAVACLSLSLSHGMLLLLQKQRRKWSGHTIPLELKSRTALWTLNLRRFPLKRYIKK